MATIFAGCASVTPVVFTQTDKVYDSPKEKVWAAVIAEVGMEYPVKVVEKESGFLTTDNVSLPTYNMERWICAPSGFLMVWESLRMNMRIMVVDESGKTKVTIKTHYEIFESNVTKTWFVCQSNGRLENEILSGIEKKLKELAKVPTEVPTK